MRTGWTRGAVLALALAAGCKSSDPTPEQTAPVRSEERLALEDLIGVWANRIEEAADEISRHEPDIGLRRRCVQWKTAVIPIARRSLLRPNVRVAFTSLWHLTVVQRIFMEENPEHFGVGTPLALEACLKLEETVEAAAPQFLNKEQRETARTFLAEASNPYSPEAGEEGVKADPLSSAVGKTLSIAQMPFSAINPTSGLSDTAMAAHRIASVANDMRIELGVLPEKLRWQYEFMLLTLEENQTVLALLEDLDRVNQTAAEISHTAASLPEELRTEVTELLTDVEAQQAEIRATLQQVDTTLAGVDTTLANVDTALVSAEKTAGGLTELTRAVDTFMAPYKPDPNAPPEPEPAPAEVEPGEEAPPFDINDYARTADSVTESVTALSALVAQLQESVDSGQGTDVLAAVLTEVDGAVDRLLVRAALFVLFLAAVFVAVRLTLRRLSDRPRP